jgi:hypothetical protein
MRARPLSIGLGPVWLSLAVASVACGPEPGSAHREPAGTAREAVVCGAGPLPPAPANGPMPASPPQTTAFLTDSGESLPPTPLAVVANARDPAEPGLTSPMHVSTPSAACARLLHLFSPAVAVPSSSRVREIEASFNGTPLTLMDPGTSQVTEVPHSYGEQMPFFKPLFSLEGVAPGVGTLVINGFDGSHGLVASQSIPGVQVVAPPPAVQACQFSAAPHPRLWITPARLARAKARDRVADPAAARFWGSAGLQSFLANDPPGTDVTDCSFDSAVYDKYGYIPALALCHLLDAGVDDATAGACAAAAQTLALDLLTKYENGGTACDGTTLTFDHDSGYDIRFNLLYLMLAYDWLHDLFAPSDLARFVALANAWIDWYHGTPGYAESEPYENYFAGYVQGLLATIVATAGENDSIQTYVDLLNEKLYWEMPVVSQRVCGGDWPEGWNYAPHAVQELALFYRTLADYGSDWSAEADWIQAEPTWMTYAMSPDFAKLFPFGTYSGNFPDRLSPNLLAVLSSTTAGGSLAARIYTGALAAPTNDVVAAPGETAYEAIFADTSVVADVSSLPLSLLAPGTGRWISRSSFTDPSAYTVTAEDISYQYDNYGYANGDVRLYEGSTCLLCPAAYSVDPNGNFDGTGQTPDFSTYLVNGSSQPLGNRDAQVLFAAEGGTWGAIGLRFDTSYTSGFYEEDLVSPNNPLDYLIREAVHVRPGTLVVRDLSSRRHASDTMTARWHLGPIGSVVRETNGRRIGALHVDFFFRGATVKPAFGSDAPAGEGRVGTLMVESYPRSTSPVEAVHVFSDRDTAVSYTVANNTGVLRLSSGTCVTFGGGTVNVGPC